MALKKLKWLKYLFVNRTEAETEQNYWNEKRRKHLANEHSEGIVTGLGVTETSPVSLSVEVAAGRALDSNGNDPEVESVQTIDLASLVPASGTRTVYITLKCNEVEVEPYFVDEIAGYQNKYVQDSFQLEATTSVPSAPAIELARVTINAGATAITNASSSSPKNNEIDLRYRKYSGKEVTALKDLSDIDENEADAFNGMENPSASNPITTVSKADSIVAPVREEVTTARGTKSSLDDRLDMMLNNDGSFKGITKITPSSPLTGGGTAGDVPLGISNATASASGAMSATDKAKLDGIESGATGDQTASEILTALKTVDGSGSGLDADLLDGVEHRGAGGTSEHPVATTSQAGFMSASDKSKLDGIESGATADMTASEILNALKTVDGAGSGLDADLLDGVSHRGEGGGEHAVATSASAGFMSAADKQKLDTLAEPGSVLQADIINEKTVGAGVTVDGVLHKDGKLGESYVQFDKIAGHNHDGVSSRMLAQPDGSVTLAKLKMAQGSWAGSVTTDGGHVNIGLHRYAHFNQSYSSGGEIGVPQISISLIRSYGWTSGLALINNRSTSGSPENHPAGVSWDYHTN